MMSMETSSQVEKVRDGNLYDVIQEEAEASGVVFLSINTPYILLCRTNEEICGVRYFILYTSIYHFIPNIVHSDTQARA